jgi:hypothetical protein
MTFREPRSPGNDFPHSFCCELWAFSTIRTTPRQEMIVEQFASCHCNATLHSRETHLGHSQLLSSRAESGPERNRTPVLLRLPSLNGPSLPRGSISRRGLHRG